MSDKEYNQIVDMYIDMVYRLALSYTKSCHDANDVVQDVFLKLYTKAPVFEDELYLKRWLMRVTINECKNLWNSYWWKNTEGIDDYANQLLTQDEEASDLYMAVMELPKKYRICIHLFYFEDYSTREMAELLHEKESTVRMRLVRGRKLLKQRLKEAWFDEESGEV